MLDPNAISIGRVKKKRRGCQNEGQGNKHQKRISQDAGCLFFIFLSEPDAEQRCAADPDEGGERADHGENGTADADTRERQITDRGNVADVHTVYNAVQNTHELCQHARKSNTGNQFSDRVGSEMVYSFHRKIPCRFLGLGTDSKKHARNKIRKTLFRTCRFWSVLIDQLTEKLFSKSGQIYFEIVRSLSVYGVVSGSLLCVQVDFDLAF